MREILFKAKRLDNGEWVEGALLDGVEHCLIGQGIKFSPYTEDECKIVGYKVDRNTLCQYTGLTDKHGNKIWENDIVFVTDDEGNSGMVDTGIGEIDFLEGLWYISGYVQNSLYDINKCYKIEVLGNVFDNADLLGKE